MRRVPSTVARARATCSVNGNNFPFGIAFVFATTCPDADSHAFVLLLWLWFLLLYLFSSIHPLVPRCFFFFLLLPAHVLLSPALLVPLRLPARRTPQSTGAAHRAVLPGGSDSGAVRVRGGGGGGGPGEESRRRRLFWENRSEIKRGFSLFFRSSQPRLFFV